MCVYINELNLREVYVYKPPSAQPESLSNCLKSISVWMDTIEKEFSDARFVITGDFNMKDMKSWDQRFCPE